jgi:hypothetical protein
MSLTWCASCISLAYFTMLGGGLNGVNEIGVDNIKV